MKRAIVTGVTGQDGSYLAEYLIGLGYEVHGLVRRSSVFNTTRIDHIYEDVHNRNPRLVLHYGDMLDSGSLRRLFHDVEPDEVYNLAAQSHVRVSFDMPAFSVETIFNGTLNLLETAREYQIQHKKAVRVYQAGSSEMFGAAPPPQSEDTKFHPRSPYAVAKVAAHMLCVNYRESYSMFVANGILFNHESPRRGETFVTRKVTRAAARIALGLQDKLYLGNLESFRDWGFAGDYVKAMHLMLQHSEPDDFVIGTGESYSVRDLVNYVFNKLNVSAQEHISYDDRYLRPSEVDHLKADISKAKSVLKWQPETKFHQLLDMMIESDLRFAEQESLLRKNGYGR